MLLDWLIGVEWVLWVILSAWSWLFFLETLAASPMGFKCYCWEGDGERHLPMDAGPYSWAG
jgi:hypothetical protein